jgi:hypothetical protein
MIFRWFLIWCISCFGSGSESITSSYGSGFGSGSCKKFRIRIHNTAYVNPILNPDLSCVGSLDKKRGKKFSLLFIKKWHRLSPFLSNEAGTTPMCKLFFAVKNIVNAEWKCFQNIFDSKPDVFKCPIRIWMQTNIVQTRSTYSSQSHVFSILLSYAFVTIVYVYCIWSCTV